MKFGEIRETVTLPARGNERAGPTFSRVVPSFSVRIAKLHSPFLSRQQHYSAHAFKFETRRSHFSTAKNTFRFDCDTLDLQPRVVHMHVEKIKHIQLLLLYGLVLDIDLESGHKNYEFRVFGVTTGIAPVPEPLKQHELNNLKAGKAVLDEAAVKNEVKLTRHLMQHLLEAAEDQDE